MRSGGSPTSIARGGMMAEFPLTMRYRKADGSFGPAAIADDMEKARDFLAQWRHAGYIGFVVEDVAGQRIEEAGLST